MADFPQLPAIGHTCESARSGRHAKTCSADRVARLGLLVPGVATRRRCRVVRDTSGAVLPGATVEASSPALIERVKSATTNEAGQYRVVDLRPGTYTVTFTLSGFSTIVREGIVLEANFTAPLNVELTVGNVTETITVKGETPIVDVQTSQRREVVPQVLLETVPTGRNYVLMAGMLPSVTTGAYDVGGSSTMSSGGSLLVHGSLAGDSRNLIDGIMADGMFANGQCSCIYDNEAQTQEMVVQVSGGAAENQLSGVWVNRIPRTGGNNFSGDTLVTFSNTGLQAATSTMICGRGGSRQLGTYRQPTSTTAWAGRSSKTGCGSSRRGATGPTTTTSRTPSIRMEPRRRMKMR